MKTCTVLITHRFIHVKEKSFAAEPAASFCFFLGHFESNFIEDKVCNIVEIVKFINFLIILCNCIQSNILCKVSIIIVLITVLILLLF